MTRRKQHNARERMERYCRSMLRLHSVAVLDSEAADLQTLIDYKRARVITASSRAALNGVYKAEQLGDVIETLARDLLDQCNPLHHPRLGWIAIPDSVSLSEDHAARIFETFGSWPKEVGEA